MDKALKSKITDLFEYRGFPFLYRLASLPPETAIDFNEKLIDLQASIYYLDAHLESNWITDPKALEKCWDAIYDKLLPFRLTKAEMEDYTSNIRKYQQHELELRINQLPTRFDMEFFYYYKSCDVKLLRTLIYRAFPTLEQMAILADWRYFDLVTEVNDDVEDLFEDTDTINGNRFLIELVTKSLKDVMSNFEEFLSYVDKKATTKHSTPPHNELQDFIYNQTIFEVKRTKRLAFKNAEKFKEIDDTKIKLYHYLNKQKSNLPA